MHRLGGAPPVEAEVADAHVAHEPRLLQPAHALHLTRQRDQGVGLVDLVEVDGVDLEAPRAPPPSLFDDRRDRENREDLGGDERLLPPALERPPDGPLRLAEAVDLGRVDESDAQVEGPVDDLDGVLLQVLLAVPPLHRPELPAPQPDGRDLDPTDLYVAHDHRAYC